MSRKRQMRVGSERPGIEVIPDSERIKALKKFDRNRNRLQMRIESKLPDTERNRNRHNVLESTDLLTNDVQKVTEVTTVTKRTDRLTQLKKRSERMTVQSRFDSQVRHN